MTKRKTPTRRSFGAIRKLPSGRHQASYVGPDLARHAAPTTFESKLDAEAWLAQARRNIESGDWGEPKSAEATMPTLDDYAGSWLSTRELKPTTYHLYRWLLDQHILPTFGEVAVSAITPASVRGWHAKLATGRTAKAHGYALLKSILRTAVEDDLITRNPCMEKGASKVKRSRAIRPARLEELEAIAEAMPVRLALIVPLSAWCALRFGEVTELRRRDVDLKAGVIRIRRGVTRVDGKVIVDTPKTEAGARDVHIPPHLLPIVRQHVHDFAQIGRDGLLFYALKGGQLPHSTLRYHFDRAAETAGRPDLTPHALRHTGAVLAAQSGATIAELMARLGHTTPDMAMRYQHTSAERDLVLAHRLSELVEASPRH